MPLIASLQCSGCQRHVSADTTGTVCPDCAGALLVRYDTEALRTQAQRPGERTSSSRTPRERLLDRSMWRYRELLPAAEPVTLGEGWTPLLESRRYAGVWLKQEAANPTGSFEARAMSMAVTMARHRGFGKVAATGEAAVPVAAYAAAAGMEAHIFTPRDAPVANRRECLAYGAHVTLVEGQLADCARMIAERAETEGWLDVSAGGEPYRLEGEKTIGYELVEQLGWEYPDAMIYPAREVGSQGLRKAFDEMEQLGWVAGRRPKMIAAQGCGQAPESVQTSGGCSVDFPKDAVLAALRDWAAHEGMLLSPEGAAGTAAYDRLRASGYLGSSDRVVVVNPSDGRRSFDTAAEEDGLRPFQTLPSRMAVGGIITPQ